MPHTIQNAARLPYPGGTDAAGNARNIIALARFLLNIFPPCNRDQPEELPQGGDTPTPAP